MLAGNTDLISHVRIFGMVVVSRTELVPNLKTTRPETVQAGDTHGARPKADAVQAGTLDQGLMKPDLEPMRLKQEP